MEIRHLRCFMALAEELHFARAAAKLHIEQSPLSRTIKELEEELGAQLFIRNTRSTRLTRAGLMLMEHRTSGVRILATGAGLREGSKKWLSWTTPRRLVRRRNTTVLTSPIGVVSRGGARG